MKNLLSITFILFLLSPAVFAETMDHHVILDSLDDEDAMVFFPDQVEEGPDGNFYVLDSGDSYIKVFSPDGQYLTRFGGQGEGPGEFQRTDGAAIGFTTDGKLFFTEYFGGHHWISIMELNGDLAKVFSLDRDVSFGIKSAVPLDDGGFLVHFVYNSKSRPKGDYYLYEHPQTLARVDSKGATVSEIVATRNIGMISYTPNGATTNLPFTPAFAWTLANDHEVIWSDGQSSRLQVFDFTGQLVREIETSLAEPEKVSDEDLQKWKKEREELMLSYDPVWWNRFGRVIEEYKKSIYDKPVLRTISLTPGGNIFVQSERSSELEKPTNRLFDRQGKELKSIHTTAWNVHFSDHYLLFVTYDDEEIPTIHALEHFGDELSALTRLERITE